MSGHLLQENRKMHRSQLRGRILQGAIVSLGHPRINISSLDGTKRADNKALVLSSNPKEATLGRFGNDTNVQQI